MPIKLPYPLQAQVTWFCVTNSCSDEIWLVAYPWIPIKTTSLPAQSSQTVCSVEVKA